jgi:hypothetical protein
MISRITYRTLIYIIIILAATTLSMGISFWYHKQQDKKAEQMLNEETIEMPAQQRTRFFREELELQLDQMDVFREVNRNFNHEAQQITRELAALRVELVVELGAENPDKNKLSFISDKIGQLHADLKKATIDYYLAMKEECDEIQRMKLNEIFMSVLQTNEDVDLPQRGRRYRGNFNN